MRALKLVRDVWSHPANRGQSWRALGRTAAWQVFKRLNPSGYRDIRFDDGPLIRCYSDSHAASGVVYFSGLQEYASMRFVVRYLRAGDNCIDVGAHIGVYSLLMARLVGQSGRVDAFEPNPKLCDRIRENITLNRTLNVHVHASALLDHGKGTILHEIGDGSTSYVRANQDEDGVQGRKVATEKLDNYLAARPYAFAKLDVEGAEPLVLSGAARGIERQNPPVLVMELDGYSNRYGIGTADILGWLEERDYVFGVFKTGDNTFFATERPWEHFETDRNVIAVARGHLPELVARLASR